MTHPPPEVPCRQAWEEEIPKPATLFESRAHEWGWDSKVTYARGTTTTPLGKPGKVVDSIAVRLRHPDTGARITAVWVQSEDKYGFDSGHYHDGTEYRRCGIRELTRELEGAIEDEVAA